MPELGNFRWLTVGLPGQPDSALTPSERPYGFDAAFRAPSGNQVRMVQST